MNSKVFMGKVSDCFQNKAAKNICACINDKDNDRFIFFTNIKKIVVKN